jgi:fido (protein-threonine AMPylation protein)
VPGAFEASPEFEYDELATAEEIEDRGQDVLRWLAQLAESEPPRKVDIHLLYEIHRRWFESTFPYDAGHPRASMVLNRKGTAAEPAAIVPALINACDNWAYRRERLVSSSDEDLVSFIIDNAHTLMVDVYDVHPFLGLRPLIDLVDEVTYQSAWWSATAHDHEALDSVVIDELDRQDR